ncbi:MAG TPA: HPr family phosphocarrier protein [Gammaproteobacteria bacterium]|nr:HPr family phosphocarrier protein [Gammaproteobacteria bacterium]
MISRKIRIINKLGLHARAAAKLVACTSQFQSSIEIERRGRKVNGKSIMGVMMLAAANGSEIDIHLDGPDEQQALEAVESLINARFDEQE